MKIFMYLAAVVFIALVCLAIVAPQPTCPDGYVYVRYLWTEACVPGTTPTRE